MSGDGEVKHSVLSLMPSDTPEYMTPAWLGCMCWALGKSEIVAQFRAETGNNHTLGETPLDKAIDTATGADWAFIKAFVEWANAALWGAMDGEMETPDAR